VTTEEPSTVVPPGSPRRLILGSLLGVAIVAHLPSWSTHVTDLREIARRMRTPVEELRREQLPGDLHDFLAFCREHVPPDADFLLLSPDRFLFGVRRYGLAPRVSVTYRPEWRGTDVDRALYEGRGPEFVVEYEASHHVAGTEPAFEAFAASSLRANRELIAELEGTGVYREVASFGREKRVLRRVR